MESAGAKVAQAPPDGRECLGEQGWSVKTSKGGIEALERVRSFRPDVIVCDLKMMVLHTDGLVGATRESERYGADRLCAAVERRRSLPVGQIGNGRSSTVTSTSTSTGHEHEHEHEHGRSSTEDRARSARFCPRPPT